MENFCSYSRIRIKDIAVRANVSVGTVDRVLHNRGEVSERTKELICKIIDEMGYKPNRLASTLAQKREFKIAILYSEEDLHLHRQRYKVGIDKASRYISQFGITIYTYAYLQNKKNECWQKVLHIAPDVIVYIGSDSHKPLFADDENFHHIPVYTIGGYFPESSAQHFFPQYDTAGYMAGRLMNYGLINDATVLIITEKHPYTQHDEYAHTVIGFKNFFAEHHLTQVRLAPLQVSSNDELLLKRALNDMFSHFTFVRGIFIASTNAHQIGAYLKEKKLTSIRVIGIYNHPKDIDYLKDGTFDFLIDLDLERLAYNCLTSIFEHFVFKTPLNLSDVLRINILTKENCDTTSM